MTVLLVDDDATIIRNLKRVLQPLGLIVHGCGSAEEALALVETTAFSVFIVDWGLPGLDGVSLCRELRRRGVRSGLCMVTGRSSQKERLEAFEARIDDYVVKPFDGSELRARIDGLARRVREAQAGFTRSGSIAIDDSQGVAYVGSQAIPLTRREFQLLRELLRHPGQTLSRRELLESVWGIHWDPMSNLVQVHSHNLREKLGSARNRLVTVRGEGYKLRSDGGGAAFTSAS